MHPTSTVHLSFAPPNTELREALSAVVQISDTLWVVNDETASVERLTLLGPDSDGNTQYGDHTCFALHDYLSLPVPPKPGEQTQEVDAEGLAYADGYLWLAGSHSLTRRKPDKGAPFPQAFAQLETVKHDGNRFLLARIPVVDDGECTLQARVEQDGVTRTAARLRGDANGNELTEALRADPHLQAFLAIPSKDNGFDIEGLAVVDQRVFLGLRGPVLRGWAVILELELLEDAHDPATLTLAAIGENGQLYRKHFLDLDGLGVRDLCVHGADLLVLAGPTMSLDTPFTLYCWRNGAQPERESLVSGRDLRLIRDMPSGQGADKGDDHPEGISLFQQADGETALLVVYDSAASRRKLGKKTVTADILPLM
jgi:hypothetical protein